MIKTRSHGFTLIELLVVVGVIGILSAASISLFSGSQQKARDAKRKSDLHAIAIALQQYYNDNGSYPSGASDSQNPKWLTSLVPTYLKQVPLDPLNTGDYRYVYNPQCVITSMAPTRTVTRAGPVTEFFQTVFPI